MEVKDLRLNLEQIISDSKNEEQEVLLTPIPVSNTADIETAYLGSQYDKGLDSQFHRSKGNSPEVGKRGNYRDGYTNYPKISSPMKNERLIKLSDCKAQNSPVVVNQVKMKGLQL